MCVLFPQQLRIRSRIKCCGYLSKVSASLLWEYLDIQFYCLIYSLNILYYLYIQHLQYINHYIQYNAIHKFGHKFSSTKLRPFPKLIWFAINTCLNITIGLHLNPYWLFLVNTGPYILWTPLDYVHFLFIHWKSWIKAFYSYSIERWSDANREQWRFRYLDIYLLTPPMLKLIINIEVDTAVDASI